LHDLPVEVLAKTGSAQVSNKTKTNALFVGAIPADDPELVILILIEDAKVGSINTLPTAKDVLRWYYENRIEENTALPNDSEAK
jgi:penicillin-binding protein 2